jgi:hypothetical protein
MGIYAVMLLRWRRSIQRVGWGGAEGVPGTSFIELRWLNRKVLVAAPQGQLPCLPNTGYSRVSFSMRALIVGALAAVVQQSTATRNGPAYGPWQTGSR